MSQGVTSELLTEIGQLMCSTNHLTTFGGVLSVPTSAAELLDELKNAFKFNTFTMVTGCQMERRVMPCLCRACTPMRRCTDREMRLCLDAKMHV